MRILLVDDEEGLRITLAANLELEGFEVAEAEDARQALALLESSTFDLVLSDIRMPGMSGVEMFGRVKQLHPDLPVVLMTAFTEEGQIDEAYRAGVFTVLSKPFTIDRLVGTLLRAIPKPLVLVVDDQEVSAESTAKALRTAGLEVRTSFDADTALRVLEQGEVDVIVTDLKMPGVDGAELTRRVHHAHPAVSVIVVSGYDVPELVRKAASSGAVTCLRKPVDPGNLLRAIATARAGK